MKGAKAGNWGWNWSIRPKRFGASSCRDAPREIVFHRMFSCQTHFFLVNERVTVVQLA